MVEQRDAGTGLGASEVMSGSAEKKRKGTDETGRFFYALLIVWFLSVLWKFGAQGQTQLWPVLAGFVFFEAVNRILSSLVTKPTFLPGLQAKNVDNFLNIAVSLLHSTFVGFAVICLLLLERSRTSIGKMWTHEVLTKETWPGAFVVLGASCGYFAYDQWDMLRRRLYVKAPSLLVHHAVLLTCFILALYKDSCINYMILTLLCEMHSIFLHLRKVSILAGATRKWTLAIRLEWILNWITFFTVRIAFHILITGKVIVDSKKFESGVELPVALMGMAGLNVLNFVLGQGLYKAYLRERAGKFPTH